MGTPHKAVCANASCGALFTRTNHLQRYCSPACRVEIIRRTTRAWAAAHPDRVRASNHKAAAQRYRSGDLPAFMYT